jgi:apolipoprotein N-acyltransferase
VLVSRGAVRNLPALAAALAFPATVTSLDFLLSLVSPHGTIHTLAYSQTHVVALLQVASITGVWGVTFALALLPSALAVGTATRSAAAVIVPVAALLAILGWGGLRVQRQPDVPHVRVGLVATDEGIHEVFETRDTGVALRVAREYAERIARAASRGARIVVLPEKLVGATPDNASAVLGVFGDAARRARVMVVAGINRVGETPPRNVALVFAPDGRAIAEYDKHHMLPGPETGYRAGNEAVVFDGPSARWGVAICKDMDFTGWLREYGRRDARVMAVPAWDFVVDGHFHSRMAVMRAVENGFTLVRTAQEGLLTVATAYGRVVAEMPSAGGRGALLVADVQAGPGETPYARHGDWFAWGVVIVTGVLMGGTIVRGGSRTKWRNAELRTNSECGLRS